MDAGESRGAPQHPVVLGSAAVAGAMLVAAGVVWGRALDDWSWWHLAGGLVVGASGGWLTAYDLATHRLPNRVVYPTGAALGLIMAGAAIAGVGGLGSAAAWGFGIGAAFLVLALVAGGGLGLGDVKLSAVLGAWTGWLASGSPLVFVLASFVTGGVVALALMLARRANRTTHIAFGPFLVVGAIIATWWAGA